MTTKIKILIWVLVIGVVLIVGWWVWSNFPLMGRVWPPKLEVTISTDKTEYRQGETVNMTVRNGLDKSIWYADFGCYPWWKLGEQKDKGWESIEVLLPIPTKYGEECIACPPPESTEDVLKELKPNSEISKAWNLKNCKGSIPVFINKENYRLSFAYGFSKDSWNDEIIYSNEFVIKEREGNPQETCLGTCKCMKECNKEGPLYFISTEEGASECSINSVNKTCCCSGV